MKAIWYLLALIGATLGVVAADIYLLGDRQSLVAPPESVVRTFGRQLAASRYDVARSHLADSAQKSSDVAALRRYHRRLENSLDGIDHFKSELVSLKPDRALVLAVVEGPGKNSRSLLFEMRWKSGGWKIARLPRLETGRME